MKISAVVAVSILGAASAQEWSLKTLSPAIERALNGMTTVRFAGMAPPMITRILSDEPMLKIIKYTCAPPVFEDMDAERILRVVSAGCAEELVILQTCPPLCASAPLLGLSQSWGLPS